MLQVAKTEGVARADAVLDKREEERGMSAGPGLEWTAREEARAGVGSNPRNVWERAKREEEGVQGARERELTHL